MSRDTLREALLRVFDLAEDRPDIREVARAALEAEPVGLDVERLAEALHHGTSHYQGNVNPQTETHRALHLADAEAAAAEYVRLAETP
jgi:hypothetical protein